MTLNFHARLTADGKQAKVEIQGTARELDKLADELQSVRRDGAGAAGSLDTLEAEARKATTALGQTASAAKRVRETHTLAAGSVGNLTAQFNDIGVMLASGQNPLMLAMQQGTQITQVLGPMGAGQAVKALGAAFMSLLSPINLVTIGSIAGGAALVQWITSMDGAGDAAAALEDNIDGFASALGEAAKLADLAGTPIDDLKKRFGDFADEVQRGARVAAQASLAQAMRQYAEVATGFRAGLAGVSEEASRYQQALDAAATVQATLGQQTLSNAAAFAEVERSVEEARATMNDAAETLGLTGLQAVQLDAALRDLASAEGMDGIATSASEALDLIGNMFDITQNMPPEVALIANRLREVQSAAAAGATTFDDMADAIGGAADAAARLARNAAVAARGQSILRASRDNPDFYDPRNESGLAGETDPNRYQSFQAANPLLEQYERDVAARVRERSAAGRRGGGGRSSAVSATNKERDAVRNLIAGKERELELLRATDPVQQEMIRNRQALANASTEERAKVEQLIGTIEREEQAKRRSQEVTDLLGQTAMDLIPNLVKGGDDAAAAWGRVADMLENVAWQALLLGEGPLGGLFPDGGLVGMITSAFTGGAQAKADGGMIYGVGGPTADKVPVWMSPGEFAVNAEATSRHRPLLEALNAGAALPRLAQGGALGGGGVAMAGQTVVQFIDQSSGDREVSQETTPLPGGGRLERFVISDAVAGAIATPGGGAARTLRDRYGLSSRGPRR